MRVLVIVPALLAIAAVLGTPSIGGTTPSNPGISAIDLHGRALGAPASRAPSTRVRVTLQNDATARATLRIAQAANFPAARCNRTAAAGIRVYPPGQTASKTVPFPFDACARRGPVYLSIGPVRK
jgi:Domain of unknown function (DUF4232)